MIIAFLKTMLGSLSPLLDYVMQNNQVVNIVLIVILVFYLAGRVQLRNIRQKSEILIVELAREIVNQKPQITKSELYKMMYPSWATSIRKWAFFIPSKHDFYPVRATPENVGEKFLISPDWMMTILQKNDVIMDEMINSEQNQA